MADDRDLERILSRLRWIAGTVFVGLVVFLAAFDSIVRGFFNPDFHVDGAFLPTLVGAVTTILALSRFGKR